MPGLVEDAVLAEPGRACPGGGEALIDVAGRDRRRVGCGLLADEQVRVGCSRPSAVALAQPGVQAGEGEFVKVNEVPSGASVDGEAGVREVEVRYEDSAEIGGLGGVKRGQRDGSRAAGVRARSSRPTSRSGASVTGRASARVTEIPAHGLAKMRRSCRSARKMLRRATMRWWASSPVRALTAACTSCRVISRRLAACSCQPQSTGDA